MLYCNVSFYDIIEYRNMKFIYYGLSSITYYSKKCLVNEKNSVFFLRFCHHWQKQSIRTDHESISSEIQIAQMRLLEF
jgi:hypothetical protein